MEKLIIIVVSLALLVVIALFVLGYRSQSGAAPGMADGRLQPCPETPNCVCSEYEANAEHFIEPLALVADSAIPVRQQLAEEIREMGGVIREQREDYVAATFTPSIFRYVDDLEIRVDVAAGQIHLRSASRVGRSDLGANRARVERLKAALQSNVS